MHLDKGEKREGGIYTLCFDLRREQVFHCGEFVLIKKNKTHFQFFIFPFPFPFKIRLYFLLIGSEKGIEKE